MTTNSLSSLIKSKSSEEDLNKANLIVEEISKLYLQDIEEFINECRQRYSELSISEAYALLILEEKYNHSIVERKLYQDKDIIEAEKRYLMGAYYKTINEAEKKIVK